MAYKPTDNDIQNACLFAMSGGQCAGCLAEGASPSSQRFFLQAGHIWPKGLAEFSVPKKFHLVPTDLSVLEEALRATAFDALNKKQEALPSGFQSGDFDESLCQTVLDKLKEGLVDKLKKRDLGIEPRDLSMALCKTAIDEQKRRNLPGLRPDDIDQAFCEAALQHLNRIDLSAFPEGTLLAALRESVIGEKDNLELCKCFVEHLPRGDSAKVSFDHECIENFVPLCSWHNNDVDNLLPNSTIIATDLIRHQLVEKHTRNPKLWRIIDAAIYQRLNCLRGWRQDLARHVPEAIPLHKLTKQELHRYARIIKALDCNLDSGLEGTYKLPDDLKPCDLEEVGVIGLLLKGLVLDSIYRYFGKKWRSSFEELLIVRADNIDEITRQCLILDPLNHIKEELIRNLRIGNLLRAVALSAQNPIPAILSLVSDARHDEEFLVGMVEIIHQVAKLLPWPSAALWRSGLGGSRRFDSSLEMIKFLFDPPKMAAEASIIVRLYYDAWRKGLALDIKEIERHDGSKRLSILDKQSIEKAYSTADKVIRERIEGIKRDDQTQRTQVKPLFSDAEARAQEIFVMPWLETLL